MISNIFSVIWRNHIRQTFIKQKNSLNIHSPSTYSSRSMIDMKHTIFVEAKKINPGQFEKKAKSCAKPRQAEDLQTIQPTDNYLFRMTIDCSDRRPDIRSTKNNEPFSKISRKIAQPGHGYMRSCILGSFSPISNIRITANYMNYVVTTTAYTMRKQNDIPTSPQWIQNSRT